MYGHCYHTTQAMFYLLDTDGASHDMETQALSLKKGPSLNGMSDPIQAVIFGIFFKKRRKETTQSCGVFYVVQFARY